MIIRNMDVESFIRNTLEAPEGDPARELLKRVVEAVMSAEVDGLCGAEYGERSAERCNCRNGYRSREWDTRVGTIDLDIPKLRKGSYFPSWLLEPRRRAEKALWSVIAEAYVLGVSTRRVEKLVQTMGLKGVSKSQVSDIAKELDEAVAAFRSRPLDTGPYRYLWLDALVLKCRDGGRVRNVSCLVGVGVNADGRREVVGFDVVTGETGAGWLAFLRSLVARGLHGVELVISDAHPGLVDAIAATMTGASWQRCRTHFMRNLLTRVPKKAQSFVATVVRTIFSQPDADEVHKQHRRVVEQLEERFPDVACMLEDAKDEILAFAAFPKAHWKQIWSNNPQERLNKEIRRRTDVVGIFPNRRAIVRLIGAVLAEQTDEWTVTRRYMSFDVAPTDTNLPALPPADDETEASARHNAA